MSGQSVEVRACARICLWPRLGVGVSVSVQRKDSLKEAAMNKQAAVDVVVMQSPPPRQLPVVCGIRIDTAHTSRGPPPPHTVA